MSDSPTPAVTGASPSAVHQQLRTLLCRLGDAIRDHLLATRHRHSTEELSGVAEITVADTIYGIDKIGEHAIIKWFSSHWPSSLPAEIVMEGLEGRPPLTFPTGTPPQRTDWKIIIDPIDGTRPLMYDKRPAWSLAAAAPQRGAANHLGDLVVAAMTELPTSKQWRADQFSAVRGCGPRGLVAEAVDVRLGTRSPLTPRPSQALDLRHGFGALVKFFPVAKAFTARLEEELFTSMGCSGADGGPPVFDDQYISTGGQLHEMLAGRDRVLADLRPLIFRHLGLPDALSCHPYDICTALIFSEAGGCIEAPDGSPLSSPLDTTTPVAWVAYANPALAALVRPRLLEILHRHGLLPAR